MTPGDPQAGTAKPGAEPLDLSENETPGAVQPGVITREVDAKDLLGFAKLITTGIAWVGVIFAVLAIAAPVLLECVDCREEGQYGVELSRQLLTVVTSILPPILTLVLGFYFGRKG